MAAEHLAVNAGYSPSIGACGSSRGDESLQQLKSHSAIRCQLGGHETLDETKHWVSWWDQQVIRNNDVRHDWITPNDAAHSTNLHFILSLLTDGEVLDVVQNQSIKQKIGSVASDGGALEIESTLQVLRNAASNLVPGIQARCRASPSARSLFARTPASELTTVRHGYLDGS